jgi:hypothetical protein
MNEKDRALALERASFSERRANRIWQRELKQKRQ